MDKSWYRKFFGRPAQPDLTHLRAQAEQGDAEAQFSLGLRYGNGTGASLDFVQAAQWYRKAADQDHALAQFNLAVMYTQGQGMPVDNAAAAQWTQRAADLGDAGAQFNLAVSCHRASFDEHLDAAECRIEAYKWYFLAAAQGYRNSDVTCGQMTTSMSSAEVAEGNQRAAQFAHARSGSRAGA